MNELDTLLVECGHFAGAALETIAPALAQRLVGAELFVGLALDPPRAQLLVASPAGEVTAVHRGAIPPALGEAAAAFLTCALGRLPPSTVAALAQLQAHGAGRLSVLVARDTAAAHLLVDTGDVTPRVLATLQAAPGQAH